MNYYQQIKSERECPREKCQCHKIDWKQFEKKDLIDEPPNYLCGPNYMWKNGKKWKI